MNSSKEPQAPDFLPQLTGCFAQPVRENPTVAMVEAAYRHHQLHFRYINCEVSPDNLQTAVAGAKAMGWVGFNCSLPHKVAVIEHLDGLGASAQLIGAVNTVVRRESQWIGENTDGKGFLQSLLEVIDPQDKKVTLFGAGGAARAISVELALAGVSEIIIVNRNRDRASKVVDLLNENPNCTARYHSWRETYAISPATDILINATSVGLFPHVSQQLNLNFKTIKANMVVADAIPNPPMTHLIRTARDRGCTTIDGLQMLVNQGVIGIKYWTGVDVDPAVMHKELRRVLSIEDLS